MANDKHQRNYTGKAGGQLPAKPKKASEPFAMLPFEVMRSEAYKSLGYSGRALLIELVGFYYGSNNGQLWIAPEMLKERGFSKNTAFRSYKELLIHGFIFQTKKGGSTKGVCSWYALTWLAIDKSDGMDLTCYQHKKFLQFIPVEKKCTPKLGITKTQNGYHLKGKALQGNSKELTERLTSNTCETQNGSLNKYLPSIGKDKQEQAEVMAHHYLITQDQAGSKEIGIRDG
jgi:hypothetical protein